jgi:hypothetical protein
MSVLCSFPVDTDGETPGSYLSLEAGYESWILDSVYQPADPTPFLRSEIERQWPVILGVCEVFCLMPPHIFFHEDPDPDREWVACYFAGSTNDPCISLKVSVPWDMSPGEVLVTIAHELAHARLESVFGEDILAEDHEDIVEQFGRDVLELGLPAAFERWQESEARLECDE